MLALSGNKIILKNLKVAISQELAIEEQSGLGSSTDKAETGNKAKVLSISGILPFSEHKHLATLFALAGAKDDDKRTTYRISNRTARAAKVTQVKFQGSLRADENESIRAWAISFELGEHLSVAEREEKKEPPKPATQQKAEGVETKKEEEKTQGDVPPQTNVETSWLMDFLQSVDDALA